MDIYHQILKQYWGYDAFRPLQEEIIHSICEGKDTLGLMPTGGGKSLTFQVSALTMEGICIVITPLIALMKDQVENLRKRRIKATAIYTGMTPALISQQLDNCIFGGYKFLYVSPERLASDVFHNKLMAMKVCLITVDESHCISQWGYDFRPSYLNIANIRTDFPDIPILALTATATPEVTEDIQDKLLFHDRNVFKMSFFRENLSYIVRRTEDKIQTLKYILNRVPGTAIVYVRNRKKTKEIALALRAEGISADFFHAGLNIDEKELRQDRWKNDSCRVIVSTNAFGMGIDKPDVRLVVHIDMPGSLEEYYQEAGRGGRDGKRAYAVVLISENDEAKLKRQLTDDFPDKKVIARVYEALCNFFSIAMGFGLNTVHDFDIDTFSEAFHFSQQQVDHSLHLLELSGYLRYEEEPESNSRLMMRMDREALYDINISDPKDEMVLKMVFRIYPGIFADYVYISEPLLATRSGFDERQVYQSLVNLSRYGILDYVPLKRRPRIIFVQSREEKSRLYISETIYEERRVRMEKRIVKVLEYINSDTICRSRMLLAYFGETQSKDCGCCDVCLDDHLAGLKNYQVNHIRETLLKELEKGDVNSDAFCTQFDFPKSRTIAVLRYISDHDDSIILDNGIFRLATPSPKDHS